MDWIKRMNDSIAYIEENLDGEIDYSKAAKFANCSAYHFQRVFSYMAGTSLTEYIRRRRLTMAAFDLQASGMKVIDVAVKYGYDSPTAFSRAFHALHSMTPSEAKDTDKSFVSYPPITFQITVKGVTAMNYRVEKKDAIRIVGVKLTTSNDDGRNWNEIPKFWEQCYKSGIAAKIEVLSDKEPSGLLGIGIGLPSDDKSFDYYIAAATDKPVPDGMSEYIIQPLLWAIFESVGSMPTAFQELNQRVVSEWFPSSGYEYGETYGIESYTEGDSSAKDYKAYMWIPVVKKCKSELESG